MLAVKALGWLFVLTVLAAGCLVLGAVLHGLLVG